MIATLVAVLEGIQVLPYAFWAAGGAVAAASLWTSFHLHRRVAEIWIDDEWVYVRSMMDVVTDTVGRGSMVLDVRDYGPWAHVTVGLTAFELDRKAWPDFDGLLEALSRSQTR